MRRVLLIASVGVSLSGDAIACSCIPQQPIRFVSPSASTIAPRNAKLFLHATRSVAISRSLYAEVDGEQWPVQQEFVNLGYDEEMLVLDGGLYPENADVEILYPGGYLGWSFQVGTYIDKTPPVWSGEMEVISVESTGTTCGDYSGHSFYLTGVSDDFSATEDLMVVMVPIDVEGASTIRRLNRQVVQIFESVCEVNDPTLVNKFHRTYRVWVEDLAGNRSEEFEVSTRERQCGCSSQGSSSSIFRWMAPMLLLGFWNRRSRH